MGGGVHDALRVLVIRIILQTPFIFLYFILREREKQETKRTPPSSNTYICLLFPYEIHLIFTNRIAISPKGPLRYARISFSNKER